MLAGLLGLRADGFERPPHVRCPVLPDGMDAVTLRDLRVADATVSLRFRRRHDGVRVEVLALDGTLAIPGAHVPRA